MGTVATGERQWRDSVRQFVLAQLPARPARVLEIGCGEGELALDMAAAGHRVTAVDPEAPEGPIFRRARLEDLDDPGDLGPYDAAVACLSLHHVADLAGTLDTTVRLLGPAGRLLVVEYGWDRIDDATASWYWRHLPADPDGQDDHDQEHEHGFLWSCCRRWLDDRAAGTAAPFERYCQEWARGEGMHDSATMLRELRARWTTASLTWGPYLYADLDATAADEQAGIDRGEIRATSFRFVGQPR